MNNLLDAIIAAKLAGGGGGGGGEVTPASIVTATGQMTYAQQVATAQNIGVAPLRLTATPTAGPSGTELMSGTWSGATWEQVVTAIQNSRLIQVDFANYGKITLLYNLGSNTNAASNAYVYGAGGVLYNVFAELFIVGGNNKFRLTIINARTRTVNITGTAPIISPTVDTVYNCGELTSLTISNPPATGKYSIIFYSGATATTTVGIENFIAEANKRYKITVEDNYAIYDSWPYTPA